MGGGHFFLGKSDPPFFKYRRFEALNYFLTTRFFRVMNNRDRSKGQMMTFLNMLNFIAKNANFLILSIFAENRKDQKKSLKFLEVALE